MAVVRVLDQVVTHSVPDLRLVSSMGISERFRSLSFLLVRSVIMFPANHLNAFKYNISKDDIHYNPQIE